MIERKDQKISDTWDLSSLFASPAEWEKSLEAFKSKICNAEKYKGSLGVSKTALYNALSYIENVYMELEKLSSYAFLSFCQDGSDSINARMAGLINNIETELATKLSYFEPELMNIDRKFIADCLSDPEFSRFRVFVEKTLREKEHILTDKEEQLLSLFSSISSGFSDAFNDLNNIDMKFNDVNGQMLSHATFHRFMLSKDEKLREKAYENYYKSYAEHKHVISKLYENSVKKDIFLSKARGYKSSIERALFPDNMPISVYTSLIESVHDNFPTLHRFYKLKADLLGKSELRPYDVYTQMVDYSYSSHNYDQAVNIIYNATEPLGDEYRNILRKGLSEERWVDKYENKGKRSGAFSAGGYYGYPYILTNFDDSDLSSVFTLIHEGGHSMHSYYSARNNPFLNYSYSIFEAEVASTFNENLLHHYLQKHASDPKEEAFLIAKNLDDIVATLFRQTMFAEFELNIHRKAEAGAAITLNEMRNEYRNLLEAYFGPIMKFKDESDLEYLRIPHFYRAFYCYKYATGISASIALSENVIAGGKKEREQFLCFLKSGGSVYPLESLRKAGVDMATKIPVNNAIEHFESLLDRIEILCREQNLTDFHAI